MDSGITPTLTEARVREVFRIYSRQMWAIYNPLRIPGLIFRLVWGVFQSPEARMRSVVRALTSGPAQRLTEIATEQQRIEAIAKLIAMLGLDDARAQATDLSRRVATIGWDLDRRAWKFSRRESSLLEAARVINGDVSPIQPDEVDAVYRALDEIRGRSWFFRRVLQNAEWVGRQMRENPEEWAKPDGPRKRSVEARAWLARKHRGSVLAVNRFGGTEAAQAFVEELYAAGAVKVLVPGHTIESDDDEGIDHSDSLRVKLPGGDREARRRVFDIVNREALDEGFDEATDTGQKELSLWWD